MSSDPRFSAFLKERIGLDVASVGEAIIERAVRQRCQASQAQSTEAYWQLLQHSHDEQQALIEYRNRVAQLTEERSFELAELLEPLTGAVRPQEARLRLLKMANFLLGER